MKQVPFLDPLDTFAPRHIGPRGDDVEAMLKAVGAPSLDDLIDEAIPASIRIDERLDLPPAESESAYLARLKTIAKKNKVFRSFIGLGYSDTLTPSVIRRCVFENPGWYTPYTPYQAEIAQGRLESLLNFQTMVTDLTGMAVANASLLDEGTAAGEAMALLHRVQSKKMGDASGAFLVSDRCFPQTIAVLRSRAEPLGIELRVGPADAMEFGADVFGALVQYPDEAGRLDDLRPFIKKAHDAGVLVAVATDLLALALATSPGEMGADVAFGNSQRFGVPLGFGGPHAAFFATSQDYVRHLPGRVIGVSVDAHGKRAYRMALQTREQHIRREKATSNICTAQALLANMAAMYAVYHGPEGIKAIALRVHTFARSLEGALAALGYQQINLQYFDTLRIRVDAAKAKAIREASVAAGLNFRFAGDSEIGIALDETVTTADLTAILDVFASASGAKSTAVALDVKAAQQPSWPKPLQRTSPYLTHAVFNTHRSETEMMRYIRSLERKDVGLDTSMIPLGSCTMKLNAATEMYPVSWEEFSRMHPFAPDDQTAGYRQICEELEAALCAITGFAAVSLQPNSGAQGEFAGLAVMRAYHQSRGEGARDVVLIPASAHGTNPASAVMAGFKVVVVTTDADGNIDVSDLKKKAEAHAKDLAGLMITYPSTHGVFEDSVRDICATIHQYGGQVYMDGANMNAQVGLTSPADDRRGRVPPEPAQDVRDPARRRRSRHGSDRRGEASRAVPPRPSARQCAWGRAFRFVRPGDPAGVGGAVGQREHPADLVRLHPHARPRRRDQRDEVRDPQRQLHQVAAREALRRALHPQERPRRARDDLRPARLQVERRRRRRRRQAADGLRLPRADRLVPGAGHADDRADRKRIEGRARSLLRRADFDPRGNRRRRQRQGGCERQRAEARAAHGGRGVRRRLAARLLARAGGLSAAVGARQQVLAERRTHRQPVRRPQPDLHLSADGSVRLELGARCEGA